MPTQEEIEAQAAQEKTATEALSATEAKPSGTTEHMIPKSRFDEVNQAKKELQERLETLEKESKERLEKQLQEQGKYKELAEERAKQLAELQPKAEQIEIYETTLKGVLNSQIAQIPEDRRTLVPSALSTKDQLDWIAQNQKLLLKSTPFNIGAGEGNNGSEESKTEITPAIAKGAKLFNLSDEQVTKIKNRKPEEAD